MLKTFCSFVLYPWGQHLGLKKTTKLASSLQPNETLEKAYKTKQTKLSHKDLEALAKKVDLDVRQVERWMRKRTAKDKPSTLAKFSESGCECEKKQSVIDQIYYKLKHK
jgi:hypothetical protein